MPQFAQSHSPRAALLDVDGTLIDSNDAHARAWVDAFAEHGREVRFNRIRPLIGMGGDKLMPKVAGIAHDSAEGKQIGECRAEIFLTRYLSTLRPFPRARELLERFRDEGLVLVVATSAREEEFKKLISVAGVEDLLDAATTSSDVKRSKPDPDVIVAALEKSGCAARDAVMLGDTPFDVEAAVSAGVAVVALRSGGWSDEELLDAAAIYDDPAHLLANYEGSPFSPHAPARGRSSGARQRGVP